MSITKLKQIFSWKLVNNPKVSSAGKKVLAAHTVGMLPLRQFSFINMVYSQFLTANGNSHLLLKS